ncbi:MAG: hypothetical protein IJL64_02560 [Bacteroidales bacterium]|jgi:hypothetical protein|nr:hypothetical protein [Bacteroidales bacterium]MBR3287693.1 hypothetical protein [Bacteroidales bacterium]
MNETTTSPQPSGNNSSRKGLLILLTILLLALAAGIGILFAKLKDVRRNAAEVQEVLETQKAALENDLSNLQAQFGMLETDNDSLKTLAEEQQEHIEKLIKEQGDNLYKIKQYQKELSTLREVLKSYIAQVDSLNTRNVLLTQEKRDLTMQLDRERSQTEMLTREREALTSTVQKAQELTIADLVVEGLTSRGSVNTRVNRIAQLQACFTVRANQVAAPGERTFYIVIKRPDGGILPNKAMDSFVVNGADALYTARRTVNYENKDLEVCIYADLESTLAAGDYSAEVFCDGISLGKTTVAFK